MAAPRVSGFLCCVLAAGGALAQEHVEPRKVTLAEAIAAVTTSPGRRAIATRIQAAETAVSAAGAWPPFAFGVATTKSTAHAILTAAVPLPIFGTLGADRDVARGEYDIARAENAAAYLDERQKVSAAWIELARAEARQAVSAEIAENENRLAEATRRRASAGDASRADVLTAETSALHARAEATSAADGIGVASAELAALLSWDPEAPLHAEGGLPEPEVPRAVPATQHPDARAAAARVATERAHVDKAYRARFPALSLDLEADIDDPTLPGTDLRGGLVLEIPLLGHGGDAQHAAELQLRAAELDETAVKKTVQGRLVAVSRRARATAARARTLSRDVVPAQRETASLMQTSYREGQARLLDVLAANRALADAELEAIDALAEAARAAADLEQASGAPGGP